MLRNATTEDKMNDATSLARQPAEGEKVIFGTTIVRTFTTTGTMNRSHSHSRSGTKVHLLRVEEVVGITPGIAEFPLKPGTYAWEWAQRKLGHGPAFRRSRPVYSSVWAACNGNGQHTGTPDEQPRFDAVNCASCKPSLRQPKETEAS